MYTIIWIMFELTFHFTGYSFTLIRIGLILYGLLLALVAFIITNIIILALTIGCIINSNNYVYYNAHCIIMCIHNAHCCRKMTTLISCFLAVYICAKQWPALLFQLTSHEPAKTTTSFTVLYDTDCSTGKPNIATCGQRTKKNIFQNVQLMHSVILLIE